MDNNIADSAVAGVVLAGGLSSRMGQNKALIEIEDGEGRSAPQIARAFTLLSSLVAPCWVSCQADLAYPGYPCLFDTRPRRGPAEGLAVALRAARDAGARAILALSCDLPCMDRKTLEALLAARRSAPAGTLMTVYVDQETDRPEAMAAAYETACLPFVEAALDAERPPRLNSLIPSSRQLRIPYDPAATHAFFNMNRPEDVMKAMDFLRLPT